MAQKKEEQQIQLSDFQKKIIEKVKVEGGINSPTLEHIALHKDSTNDYYCVLYNYMGTGIHIPATEVDESEYSREGIKVFRTCSYIW